MCSTISTCIFSGTFFFLAMKVSSWTFILFTACVCIPLSRNSDSAFTYKEEKGSSYTMVWSAMKFYWHESGKTAWSVFGTMLFCLIWYMRGLFIQIELNSLFQWGKRGCLLQKGYLSFTIPLGISKKIIRILLLVAAPACVRRD